MSTSTNCINHEDLLLQSSTSVWVVEHKDAKKSNKMYYPRFTKVIINFFMTKDQSIPRRNKVNWNFSRDDHMFTVVKLVSRHQNTQHYSAILPIKLTNKAIRNTESYKEYYAIASGAEPPKTKASVKKKQSCSDITVPSSTAKGKRLKTSVKVDKPAKEKQPAKTSKAKGLTMLSEVALTKAEQMKLAIKRSLKQTHISYASGLGTDEGTGIIPGVLDVPTYEYDDEKISWKSSEEDNDNEVNMSKHDEDIDDQSDDDDEQTDSNNDGDDFIHPKFSTYDDEDKEEESFDPIVQTPYHDENSDDEDNDDGIHSMNVEGDEMDDEGENEKDDADELYRDVNINLEVPSPANVPSSSLQDLPNFRSLFRYLDHRMNEAVKVSIQLQSDRLRDEAQAENEDFLNKLDENIQKIIKEQVKEQVKAQVSKILPKIKNTVNEQLEEEVLTRSSNSSKTSHAVAANQSKLELKKILIEKMENTITLKRSNDDEDKEKEPFARSNQGCKRRRAGIEPKSTSAPKEKTSKTTGKSTEGSKSHHKSASESAPAEEPIHTIKDLEEPAHQEFDTGATKDQHVAEASQHPDWFQKQAKPPTPDRKADSRTLFNELIDTPLDFSAFVMNQLKVDTLTPILLAGLTYELMKGSCKSLVELEFFLEEVYKETTDQLDWNNPEVTKTKAVDYGHIKWIEDLVPRTMWSQVPVSYDKHALWGISHWGRKRLQFYRFTVNRESARDVYSKRRIIAVTELQIVEWHNYKHLDWITVQDLQLGVESYQKKINLTKSDTYRSDLKRKEAYIAYSNPRGFIYQNKDKQNRLMCIDELHKFNDGTLNDVWTALDDRLKGIRMQYLPQTIWRQSDKDRAAAMIQAINKQLKTRRIL
uniref:Uncharacterized protein n=1 Tax=Tanacetum cinerariifolium TaxID=118510 RepID=A0A6L2JAD6_TANCI|nr:hypothetical protein [Tanacetum cinerariifolium]